MPSRMRKAIPDADALLPGAGGEHRLEPGLGADHDRAFPAHPRLAWLGVFVFSAGAVFALATLPVEFNASARAKELLFTTGIIQTEEERRGVNRVLNAAALTYVAGLVTAVLQLLYFVTLVGGGRRRS